MREHDSPAIRDVVIVGGGAAGTYAAIQLKDRGKSIAIIEQKKRLGGHTDTYHDPESKETSELGVMMWHDTELVRTFFNRFRIPLTGFSWKGATTSTEYADFRTGEPLPGFSMGFPLDRSALQRFVARLQEYPELVSGFYLPDPVPEELLMPFGDFVEKHSLDKIIPFFFQFSQGLGNILELPTLYLFQYLNLDLIRALAGNSFLETANQNNQELYDRAAEELHRDLFLDSTILSLKRDASDGHIVVVFTTPSGQRLIRAKKLILAIPPTLTNLQGWDLSDDETRLFGQFRWSTYCAGLVSQTGLPEGTAFRNFASETKYNLSPLPGVYSLVPSRIPGALSFKLGGPARLTESEVKHIVIRSIKLLRKQYGSDANSEPNFITSIMHVPFEMTVSAKTIRDGFYKDLYSLQGRRHTYYTGAAYHTHDSSMVWKFTHGLVERLVKEL